MIFNLQLLIDNLELYFEGLILTLHLVALSLIIGFLLSIPLATIRAGKNNFVNKIAWSYTYFFRGTPLLLQIYLIYFGMGQFDLIKDSFLWFFLKEAYFCALLTFILNTTAYTSEIIAGALKNMPKNQVEAAKAFGMNDRQIYWRLILPNSLRRCIPPYSNEVIFMIHGSALVSVITLTDITGAASYLYSKYYDPFTPFIGAALIYLCLIFVVVYGFKILEKKFMSYLSHKIVLKKSQ